METRRSRKKSQRLKSAADSKQPLEASTIVAPRNEELEAAGAVQKSLESDPDNILLNVKAARALKSINQIDQANQALAHARGLIIAKSEAGIPASFAEEEAVRNCERYLRPFEHLPVEIIGQILEEVATIQDDEPIPHPFLTCHISSRLRQIALNLGTIFQDLSSFGSWSGDCLSERKRDFLQFCIENSRGTVTSLGPIGPTCDRRRQWFIGIAEASAPVLESLDLVDLDSSSSDSSYGSSSSSCDACDVCQDLVQDSSSSAAEEERMVNILYAAQKLNDYLCLDLDLLPKEEYLATKAAQSNLQAHPSELQLYITLNAEGARPELVRFLKVLMRDVTKLELMLKGDHNRYPPSTLVWPLATACSATLQELTFHQLDSILVNLTNSPAADYPHLKSLTLQGLWYTRSSSRGAEGPARIRAPQLERLVVDAGCLHLVDAPALRSVNIDLRSSSSSLGTDAQSLKNWLPSCPSLEQLELRIRLDPDRDSPPPYIPGLKQELFTSTSFNAVYILEILRSLIPRVDGSILCSKLAILGISCDSNFRPEPGWTDHDSQDWALWFQEAAMREHISHRLPDLFIPEEIYKIVRQRQLLSQGQDPEEAVSMPVHPPPDWYYIANRERKQFDKETRPVPLKPKDSANIERTETSAMERVYLRGCTMDADVWNQLLESSVEAICVPDPFVKGKRVPGKKLKIRP